MGVELVADRTWGRVRVVVTGRGGGVSSGPYATANVSANVGDAPEDVARNRALLAETVGVAAHRLHFLHQVHGDRVVRLPDGAAAPEPVSRSGGPSSGEPDADAAVLTRPGHAVAVKGADCLPLLLADGELGAAAAVHVGRRGLELGVAARAVDALRDAGARQLRALLGPVVCGLCYEVPAAMRDEVEAAAPGSAAVTRTGTPSIDIEAGVQAQLAACGVTAVESLGRCTLEDPALFSHRRDQVTGRLAGVVAVLP